MAAAAAGEDEEDEETAATVDGATPGCCGGGMVKAGTGGVKGWEESNRALGEREGEGRREGGGSED